MSQNAKCCVGVMLSVFNIAVCFRYADRAGHSYGSFKPHIKYELYGPLHETRCPLAKAGKSKGRVTQRPAPITEHLQNPSSCLSLPLLHLTVFNSDTDLDLDLDLDLCANFLHFTWT